MDHEYVDEIIKQDVEYYHDLKQDIINKFDTLQTTLIDTVTQQISIAKSNAIKTLDQHCDKEILNALKPNINKMMGPILMLNIILNSSFLKMEIDAHQITSIREKKYVLSQTSPDINKLRLFIQQVVDNIKLELFTNFELFIPIKKEIIYEPFQSIELVNFLLKHQEQDKKEEKEGPTILKNSERIFTINGLMGTGKRTRLLSFMSTLQIKYKSVVIVDNISAMDSKSTLSDDQDMRDIEEGTLYNILQRIVRLVKPGEKEKVLLINHKGISDYDMGIINKNPNFIIINITENEKQELNMQPLSYVYCVKLFNHFLNSQLDDQVLYYLIKTYCRQRSKLIFQTASSINNGTKLGFEESPFDFNYFMLKGLDGFISNYCYPLGRYVCFTILSSELLLKFVIYLGAPRFRELKFLFRLFAENIKPIMSISICTSFSPLVDKKENYTNLSFFESFSKNTFTQTNNEIKVKLKRLNLDSNMEFNIDNCPAINYKRLQQFIHLVPITGSLKIKNQEYIQQDMPPIFGRIEWGDFIFIKKYTEINSWGRTKQNQLIAIHLSLNPYDPTNFIIIGDIRHYLDPIFISILNNNGIFIKIESLYNRFTLLFKFKDQRINEINRGTYLGSLSGVITFKDKLQIEPIDIIDFCSDIDFISE
ncbi:hypothetical protein CYY_005186 [Polysphondylium violaceum]|uniref:Uncharacterized protein n=1 Tax=Polysphondylium violaceum TaxID=133409 RepID=A0A8J4PX06_9MYCE|nr:hypothetical protein CYY_005186 [Polysphondylium violaceum]